MLVWRRTLPPDEGKKGGEREKKEKKLEKRDDKRGIKRLHQSISWHYQPSTHISWHTHTHTHWHKMTHAHTPRHTDIRHHSYLERPPLPQPWETSPHQSFLKNQRSELITVNLMVARICHFFFSSNFFLIALHKCHHLCELVPWDFHGMMSWNGKVCLFEAESDTKFWFLQIQMKSLS